MARRRHKSIRSKKPTTASAAPPQRVPDPRDDLPDAPAMRAGLTVRLIEQHRRGSHQAVRRMPWQGLGLTDRQEDAAERYADLCAAMRPSPAPRSCLDIVVGGYDDSDPTEADERREAEWHGLNRAVHRVGVAPSAELTRVCWCLDPPRDVRALAVALDAVARFLGIGNRVVKNG